MKKPDTQDIDLRGRIEKFLHGPRCIRPGQPPIDALMQQWVDGALSCDPAASDKLKVAIQFSLAQVAEADAASELSGPEKDARYCYVRRAEILAAIERALRFMD
jgi:hypothetical protein